MPERPASNFRIAVFVDNPQRDLSGVVLTAWELCRRGATCFLVPMNLRNRELFSLGPDFVLLNHFRTVYEKLVSDLLKANIQVGVMDTEGGIFSPIPPDANPKIAGKIPDGMKAAPIWESHALYMAENAELRDRIACFCAWSPAFRDYAVSSNWYRPDQIVVTGPPRMDFLARRWREATRRISSDNIPNLPDPMVLFNGNFALANPRFLDPEAEIQLMMDKFAYTREFLEGWRDAQTVALNGLVSIANKLAARYPKVSFVYRPHPFEGEGLYRQRLADLPNLHLIQKGTIDGWLLRAKAIVHWVSSTSIEAALLDVPAFSCDWCPVYLPVPAVQAVTNACRTEDELIENIDRVLEGRFEFPPEITRNIDRVVHETFYRNDGESHKRVADAIMQSLAGRPEGIRVNLPGKVNRLGENLSFRAKVSAKVKNLLGLPSNWLFRQWKTIGSCPEWESSEKYYDVKTVRHILRAIDDCAKQEGLCDGTQKIRAVPARDNGDYLYGNGQGYSITIQGTAGP